MIECKHEWFVVNDGIADSSTNVKNDICLKCDAVRSTSAGGKPFINSDDWYAEGIRDVVLEDNVEYKLAKLGLNE